MAGTDDDKHDSSVTERGELVNRIDELERLLADKKAAAEEDTTNAPRMKVGTDGIPVLVETVDTSESSPVQTQIKDGMIEEIIDKVDQEISQDLDELINLLKDSIIDEVKTRLMKELKHEKKPSEPQG